MKKILEDYLPKELIYRPKQGFGVPISDLINNDLRDWTNDLLSKEIILSDNFFNYSTIEKIKNDHFSGKMNNEHKLWSILQFNQWYLGEKK